ncbi:MAG: AraC family transcriptional regulator [Clostridia bacterium]|nr:AraC family transcriptional regulator [Clostridia bacterium]
MDYIEKRFCYTVPTDLNLYYCGKRILTKNHSYGPQIRDHFLLVYIKEGDAILSVRGNHYTLSSGQLLCMFPGEKIYYTTTEESLWSNLWVGVYGTQVEFYLKNLGLTREYPIYNCPHPKETERIIDKIIEDAEVNNTYGKMKTIAKLYDFFASLYNSSSDQFTDIVPWDIHSTDTHEITYLSDNLYIREAENYIRFHYDSNISIHSLAKTLNLSTEYFSRLFKSETGITPQNMIIKYRIEKACTLLKSTTLTISEIALCVGIHDQRYFSKLFRLKMNCTPSEYRSKQPLSATEK